MYVILGRSKGPGKSKLNPYKEEIIEILKIGVPKAKIARKYEMAITTLQNWIDKNQIKADKKKLKVKY